MPTYFEATSAGLVAADFHYFRLPREKWELMLTRLRQMGVNMLTLPLPWGFHEFESGVIDLTGASNRRRDVVGLLQLCAALDFVCLLKPGPYTTDAGVLGHGLPVWLLKQSEDLATTLPQAVTGWYQAISQTLTGQQWPNGPVVALHVESEPAQIHPQALSPQLTEVKWRIWLRKRYEGIEALNAAYGATYRTVNEVKFPENWSAAGSRLEQDAQTFLEAGQHETQAAYHQTLLDSGWQIPLYPATSQPDLPWQQLTLTNSNDLATLSLPQKKAAKRLFLSLHQPIQIDPDPTDIGRGPVWAEGAPIRADGSVRPTFWLVRQHVWPHLLPETRLDNQTLLIPTAGSSIISRRGDASLKVDLSTNAKPKVYRLYLSGELVAEDKLKASRGKLSGLYLAQDEAGQTDLNLLVNDSTAPLSDFPLTYLSQLLTAQVQSLTHSAALAAALGQALSSEQAKPEVAATVHPVKSSYVLEEARRGLREADAALRKALASVSELEGGLATILGKEMPRPAVAPLAVNPAIFEGEARDVLIEVGAACAKIEAPLNSAASLLKQTLASPNGFTVEQYQQSYTTAVIAARAVREPLLEAIALLRLEIAAERLPLVAWRVHNQVQEMAENLRWGVLRG